MIGDLLIEEGIITQKQLEDGLKTQKVMGGLIGIILVNKQIITEDQLKDVLKKQHDIVINNKEKINGSNI